MKNDPGPAFFVTVVAAFVGFLTAYFEQSDILRAALAALCVVTTAFAAWSVSRRSDIVAGASLFIAVWPGRVFATTEAIAIAAALALLLTIPMKNRWQTAAAAGAAALACVVLVDDVAPIWWILPVILAAAWTLLRPQLPTRGALTAIRQGSLYFPAIAIACLLTLNAVTDRGALLSPFDSVRWALGLSVLLAAFACAGLGLGILLRSESPAQVPAWILVGVTAATVLFAVPTKDPSIVIGASFVGAPTAATLAALFISWLGRASSRPRIVWQLTSTAALTAGWALF